MKAKKNIKKTGKEVKGKKTAMAGKAISPIQDRRFQEIRLAQIRVNPLNPRKNFEGPKFDELVASIRQKGILVPILLRPVLNDEDGKIFELIAGERRFRAAGIVAKKNGGIQQKATIPAIVQSMSDDDAFDCMTIENLQRDDLTPLEEARSFKVYMDKKGPEALLELAERIGINPCYIRRRTAILSLPDKYLKTWEEGNISLGHLEQLIRVGEQDGRDYFFDMVVRQDMTVKRLKDAMEARTPKLSTVLFDKSAIGCQTCAQNTDVQRSLFGEGMASKALCLNPDCYKGHQFDWIQANWIKFKSSRKIETNGFRFAGDVNWSDYRAIHDTCHEKCGSCEYFLSIVTIEGKIDAMHSKNNCFGEKKCFDALYRPRTLKSKAKADPDAPRVPWHGEFFREEFFKTRVPELVHALPNDDEKILRIQILAILELHPAAAAFFGKQYDSENTFGQRAGLCVSYRVSRYAWVALEKLDLPSLKACLRDVSLLVLMDARATSADMRRHVAVHLGSDLSKEWRLTKEYLNKKTTKEINAIAAAFGIFKDEKARTFLYETLGKKRDRFNLCKKSELIRVVLESGVDLSGKVPAEILMQ